MIRFIRILLLILAIVAVLDYARPPDRKPALTEVNAIDMHTHIFDSHPIVYETFKRLRLRAVNICYINKSDRGFETIEPQQSIAIQIAQQSKGRIAWCATFDPQNWESPGFADRTSEALQSAFQQGAVGVKIHKSLGMKLQSKDGRYLLPDDDRLDRVFSAIADHGKTLFAHLAEPDAAWEPLNPDNHYYRIYRKEPEFHMFLHPERPSKQAILAARSRLLNRRPNLRMIGSHLGSLENDVKKLGKTLDLHRNFAVDTAARIPDLMLQPRDQVRQFFIQYQDRILYGSDLGVVPWKNPERTMQNYETQLKRDWDYFATRKKFQFRGRSIEGLDLPAPVLRKIYRENALRWIPDLR